MSTRSSITVKTGNTYKSVYCHFDGYIEGVGSELKQSYNSKEQAIELVQMGGISSLSNTIIESNFYCRDRNEDLDILEVKSTADLYIHEYNYVYDGGWKLLIDNNLEEY